MRTVASWRLRNMFSKISQTRKEIFLNSTTVWKKLKITLTVPLSHKSNHNEMSRFVNNQQQSMVHVIVIIIIVIVIITIIIPIVQWFKSSSPPLLYNGVWRSQWEVLWLCETLARGTAFFLLDLALSSFGLLSTLHYHHLCYFHHNKNQD